MRKFCANILIVHTTTGIKRFAYLCNVFLTVDCPSANRTYQHSVCQDEQFSFATFKLQDEAV